MVLKVLVVLAAMCVGSLEASFGQNNIPWPCGWKKIFNGCYLFVKTKVSWHVARANCVKQGGDLATPTSTWQCDLLSNHAGIVGMYAPWIGIFRRRHDTKFYGTCGKQVSYTRWAPSEPNNAGGNENCVQMTATTTVKGKWNDLNCNIRLGYICQIKLPKCD